MNELPSKNAKRLLWALVIGIAVLNLVLFLVFSMKHAGTTATGSPGSTNPPPARAPARN